jgi:HEPN domain-containing protein
LDWTFGDEGSTALNRAELQQLADDRIADAKLLLDNGRWAGAYYLAGYAVECALKACVAKLTKAEDFPDKSFADRCWTHEIGRLVTAAGLKSQRDMDNSANVVLLNHWAVAKDWNESSRYAQKSQLEAQTLYDAITHPTNGVLPWVKTHW